MLQPGDLRRNRALGSTVDYIFTCRGAFHNGSRSHAWIVAAAGDVFKWIYGLGCKAITLFRLALGCSLLGEVLV
jgi:hypothetical protein